MHDIGVPLVANAFKGFNCSIFAYGQTGSGKSHSMMGYPGDTGIIPRICERLFEKLNENKKELDDNSKNANKVEVSYLEIYNECVWDLLTPTAARPSGGLKVREHPTIGVFVEDLTTILATDYKKVEELMDYGQKTRTVASTNMNNTSSRSHSIFTVVFTQTRVNKDTLSASDITSKINLIDLAGSERQSSTGATGDRLKEGCAINKSLSSLGNVISALAENATLKKGAKAKFVPYRDSILTRLLQQSLGGNSKTAMIAALSPADINYEETLSTLRYADRAKKIVNKASINEEPNEKLIRELRAEIERLRKLLEMQQAGQVVMLEGETKTIVDPEVLAERDRLREELLAQQKLMEKMSMTVDDRLKEQEKQAYVEDPHDRTVPHLTNLHEDPSMSMKLYYAVNQAGDTVLGKRDSVPPVDHVFKGLNVYPRHLSIHGIKGKFMLSVVDPQASSHTFVNGAPVKAPIEIHHMDRILMGINQFFIFINPVEAQENPKYASLTVDWDLAQEELANLSSKLIGLGSAPDPEMIAKMKKLEKDLEDQKQATMMELEIQRELLQKEASQDAKTKFEEIQKKLVDDNRKLEAQLRRNREEEAERQRKFLLEDKLVKVMAMCEEANSIARELSKDIEFTPKLITTFNTHGQLHTDAGVKVLEVSTGNTSVWDYEKFQSRLYLMRDIYAEFQEWTPIDEDEVFLIDAEEDPFYDPPNSQIIGRAQVFLRPLAYGMDFDDDVPLLDYSGHERGKVHVRITPLSMEGDAAEELDDPYDYLGKTQMFRIEVQSGRDLPANLKPGFFCKYKMYDSPIGETTPVTPPVSNPVWPHSQTVIQDMTHDFIEYLMEDSLFVELFGDLKADVSVNGTNGGLGGTAGRSGSKGPLARLKDGGSAEKGRSKRAISISGLPPGTLEMLLGANNMPGSPRQLASPSPMMQPPGLALTPGSPVNTSGVALELETSRSSAAPMTERALSPIREVADRPQTADARRQADLDKLREEHKQHQETFEQHKKKQEQMKSDWESERQKLVSKIAQLEQEMNSKNQEIETLKNTKSSKSCVIS